MELTIFTPTYNRAAYLKRIYDSLQRQTEQTFLWLIVDDGSTDETKELVAQWEKEKNAFEIKYIYQENQGKPTAFNTGVSVGQTEYFFAIDSDDWLMDTSVETILRNIALYRTGEPNIGYVFQCVSKQDNLITSRPFPDSPWYGTYDTIIHHKKIVGDAAFVFVSEDLKQYPFPKYENEKFVPEALLYNRLNHFVGNFCYLNTPVKYVEYLEEGFSQNMGALFAANPHGYYVYTIEFLNFYSHAAYQTLRHVAAAGVFGRKIGKSFKEIRNDLEKTKHKILFTNMIPLIMLYKL